MDEPDKTSNLFPELTSAELAKIPRWVPPELRSTFLCEFEDASEEVLRVKECFFDDGMRTVWKKLSDHAKDRGQLFRFIFRISWCLNYWDVMKEKGLLFTKAEASHRHKELLDTVSRLIELLDENRGLVPYWPQVPVTHYLDDLVKLRDSMKNCEPFWTLLPTKINAGTSKRTFVMRYLKAAISDGFNFDIPPYNEIATLIELLLGESVTSDNIRHA